MAKKIRFRYVTGTCHQCGSNEFKFNEKRQTFVCEYCDSEVYSAEEISDTKDSSKPAGNHNGKNGYNDAEIFADYAKNYYKHSPSIDTIDTIDVSEDLKIVKCINLIMAGMTLIGVGLFTNMLGIPDEGPAAFIKIFSVTRFTLPILGGIIAALNVFCIIVIEQKTE